jgi:hypothetical protein
LNCVVESFYLNIVLTLICDEFQKIRILLLLWAQNSCSLLQGWFG